MISIKSLADKISNRFDGLYGFIGVDVTLVKKIWKVIEVKNRITSSYLGIVKKHHKVIYRKIMDFYLEGKIKSDQISSNNKIKRIIF